MSASQQAGSTLRLGTRGSALALIQAESIRDLLRHALPALRTEIVVVQSLGDLVRDRPLAALGTQGIFTHALEQAVLEARVDLAVHSAKDLPSALAGGCVLAASPAREDPHDCLVSQAGWSLAQLPAGAQVGTGSPRRAVQLAAVRGDLHIESVRGNVETRRRAALEGPLDAVVLAAAGLRRLRLYDEHVWPLPFEQCLPQAGQGVLALEIRESDHRTFEALQLIHDTTAGACLLAERAVLAGLAAGCQAPVAAFAEADGDRLHLRALVSGGAGAAPIVAEHEGLLAQAQGLGEQVARLLIARGAQEVLARARSAAG